MSQGVGNRQLPSQLGENENQEQRASGVTSQAETSAGTPQPGTSAGTPQPGTSAGDPQPGTSAGDQQGTSYRPYLADLVDGQNYRVIVGKQAKSKLVIPLGDTMCYLVDRKSILKATGETIYYLKCRNPTCKGRAQITNSRLRTNTDAPHTCPSDGVNSAYCRAQECLTMMKERAAKETTTKVQIIYNEVTRDESRDVKRELPIEKCRKAMSDARAKLIPPCPRTLEEVIAKFEDGENGEFQKIYLGHVKWQTKTRSRSARSSQRRTTHFAIIIGDKNLIEEVIQVATFFFGDATFKIVCLQARRGSARSAQVLNLIADYQGKAICILQVIMTCRKYKLYQLVADKIKADFPDFEPHFFMADYEAAFRKSIQKTWPDTRILGCRFHFAKALFAKLKSKFRLAGLFRRNGSVIQQKLSSLLRQYFGLPLLKHQHMRGELERLERELRQVCRHQTPEIAERINGFHNYVITYWMSLQGSYTISVEGAQHKTNNIAERFNQRLQSEMPQHPSLFKFLSCVQTSVIGNGFAIVAQAEGGRIRPTKMAAAAKRLLEAAVDVERRYQEGELSASEVLRCAADHFDDNKVIEAFVAYAQSQEGQELSQQAEGSSDEESGQEDDEVAELDERLIELQRDPDLTDVDPEVWLTEKWPIIRGGAAQAMPNRILEGERMEDVAVIVCQVCLVAHDNLVSFQDPECRHLICRTCFDQVMECPNCKAPKNGGPGKMINVLSLTILRKDDVESNYGVTQEMMEAAAQVTRRPGDESDFEFFERRTREAIQEALLQDGQDDDIVMRQLSNNTTATTESLPSSLASPTYSPLTTPPSSPTPSETSGRGRGTPPTSPSSGRGRGRGTARGTSRGTARGTARVLVRGRSTGGRARPRGRGRGGVYSQPEAQDRSRSASRQNRENDSEEDFAM